jgi:hypothetical protein
MYMGFCYLALARRVEERESRQCGLFYREGRVKRMGLKAEGRRTHSDTVSTLFNGFMKTKIISDRLSQECIIRQFESTGDFISGQLKGH